MLISIHLWNCFYNENDCYGYVSNEIEEINGINEMIFFPFLVFFFAIVECSLTFSMSMDNKKVELLMTYAIMFSVIPSNVVR